MVKEGRREFRCNEWRLRQQQIEADWFDSYNVLLRQFTSSANRTNVLETRSRALIGLARRFPFGSHENTGSRQHTKFKTQEGCKTTGWASRNIKENQTKRGKEVVKSCDLWGEERGWRQGGGSTLSLEEVGVFIFFFVVIIEAWTPGWSEPCQAPNWWREEQGNHGGDERWNEDDKQPPSQWTWEIRTKPI